MKNKIEKFQKNRTQIIFSNNLCLDFLRKINGSIGHGLVVWASQWNLNPNNPQNEYLDHEIWYLDIESGAVNPEHLTDDSLEQRYPNVLENHITWITTQEDGDSMTTIYPREVELEKYSSTALQFAVIATMLLTGLYSWQKMKETTPVSSRYEEE